MQDIVRDIKGTVLDLMPDARQMFEAVAGWKFKGTFEDYLRARNLHTLAIIFDTVVDPPYGGFAGGVVVPRDSAEARSLAPGQRVICDIEPGDIGLASRLIAVRPLP